VTSERISRTDDISIQQNSTVQADPNQI